MSNLPLEMIAEILCRLTAKKLLCCRCVSKRWRTLIDSPTFIYLHLNHSIESPCNLSIILKSSELYSLSFDLLDNIQPLDHPLMCYNHGVKILGSCNGLLCICNIVDDIALWNPSIRAHRVVPYLPVELKRYFGMCSCRVSVFGFGYDLSNDDYKLVRIAQFGGVDRKSFESEVKVFSLRKNSWRRIADMPYCVLYPGENGIYANGALHWLVSQDPDSTVADTIVALDLGVEDYHVVPKPEFVDMNCNMGVGVLQGCLSLLAYARSERVDVWVMEEYMVKESWSKLFSVARLEVIGILRSLKPLAYSKSGNEVLIEHDNVNLFWYDLKRKEVVNVWIQGVPITFEAEICVGSLVPLNANRLRRRPKHEHKETKNRKKRDDFLSEGFKLVL
ncbi:ubiquitin-protein ligase, putative [Ricinus communis]|uniref:Ubiquitin-protein ligase, putative n=1 Tax=Ricinus communis TaxID=3988 RepID=B9T3A0_RICCO|nr:ubiquitin-protein ligase, putative [Ricinus communis]|eukprot:XP_002532719.1 F-box protein CPR1 [Ricinus communis]